ncbi:hypothetical protein N9O57_01070 [bacterium]|nr:hypothetical protein [bacterium]
MAVDKKQKNFFICALASLTLHLLGMRILRSPAQSYKKHYQTKQSIKISLKKQKSFLRQQVKPKRAIHLRDFVSQSDMKRMTKKIVKIKIGVFGDDLSVEPTIKNDLYKKIYDHILANFIYPPYFIKKEIEGTVTARLIFEKSGFFSKTNTKLNSDSRILKNLVLKNLSKIFKDKIKYDLNYLKNNFLIIDAIFNFKASPSVSSEFMNMNSYLSDRVLSFVIIDQSGGNFSLEGVAKKMKDFFSEADETRSMFYEQRLQDYK